MDLFTLAPLGLFALIFAVKIYTTSRDSDVLRDAAMECGLRASGRNIFNTPTIAGNIGSYFISVNRVNKNKHYYFEIGLKYTHRMKVYFSLGRESFFGRMKSSIGFTDIQTRDPGFDEAIRIESDMPHVMTALLNHETREGIMILANQAGDFTITNEAASADVYVKNIRNGHELAVIIRNVGGIIACLDRGEYPWKLLIENIAAETMPAVTVENIRALAGHYTLLGEAEDVLRSCLGTRPPEVQAVAARHLGDEGMAHLAKMLGDRETPPSLLGEIIGVIRDNGYGEAATPLGKLYAKSEDPALRAKSIECLGSFGNKKLSPFVVQALEDTDAGVREAAVKALALCGTVEAVEPLGKLAESSINPFLKSEIQKAIDAIQAGIEKGGRGMLSVSKGDDMDGALSRDGSPGEGALSGDDGKGG